MPHKKLSRSFELLIPANGFGYKTFGLKDPTPSVLFATTFLKQTTLHRHPTTYDLFLPQVRHTVHQPF